MTLGSQTWAKLASLFSGVVFGIYWIPLRIMDGAGFNGLWAVMLFSTTAFLLATPLIFFKGKSLFPGRFLLHRNACLASWAFVLYSAGFLYTEVLRAIILFYLMPIWGFLFARIFIGERITTIRWASMALGVGGLFTICGFDNGIPLPRNLGDWFSLSAGIIWAISSTCILIDKQDTVNYTLAFLFWSAIVSLVVALLATYASGLARPEWQNVDSLLKWFIPFVILIVIPGAFATIYGPSQLNPGIVGLLFMVEVGVGAVTAALFSGEVIGIREIIGVMLITLSGTAEPAYNQFRKLVNFYS